MRVENGEADPRVVGGSYAVTMRLVVLLRVGRVIVEYNLWDVYDAGETTTRPKSGGKEKRRT